MVGTLLSVCGILNVCRADTFTNYALTESFSLPAGSHSFDVLADGRIVTVVGTDVYAELDNGLRRFEPLGTLAGADFSSFGPAFIRVSPGGGSQIAIGNGGGASFGNYQVGIFNLSDLSGRWLTAPHYDGDWASSGSLLLSAGDFGSPGYVSLLAVGSDDPANPVNPVVVEGIGGAPGAVTRYRGGDLLVGNGFATTGPSGTGAVKLFNYDAWQAAVTGTPLDFESSGTLVADVLSASALAFDEEGNLLVGGGDFAGGEVNFAALIHQDAVQRAIAGMGPADVLDVAEVRRLDPDGDNAFNFYDVNYNPVRNELYVREGARVFVYTVPEPGTYLLWIAAATCLQLRRRAARRSALTPRPHRFVAPSLRRPQFPRPHGGAALSHATQPRTEGAVNRLDLLLHSFTLRIGCVGALMLRRARFGGLGGMPKHDTAVPRHVFPGHGGAALGHATQPRAQRAVNRLDLLLHGFTLRIGCVGVLVLRRARFGGLGGMPKHGTAVRRHVFPGHGGAALGHATQPLRRIVTASLRRVACPLPHGHGSVSAAPSRARPSPAPRDGSRYRTARFRSLGLAATTLMLLAAPAHASPFATRVVEYAPAPGQFVNHAAFNDPSQALGAPDGAGIYNGNNWSVVTLGGFAGAITLAFDHTVEDHPLNPFGMDAMVFGNAFWFGGDPQLHWAECAAVEIALDANRNGLADDAWYVIPGSHLSPPQTPPYVQRWDDNTADATFPPALASWIPLGRRGTWTTTGFLLPPEAFGEMILMNPGSSGAEGIFGYADYSPTLLLGDRDGDDIIDDEEVTPEDFYTVPDDPLAPGMSPRAGGGDAFDIAWAVDPSTGQPAHLPGFDFLRITSAVYALHGALGETSTEIDAVADAAPDPFGDTDDDGDLDLRDLAELQACFGRTTVAGSLCVRLDRGGDGVADLTDLADVVGRLTGPRAG
ncbi:MAG: hypothetical protein HY763_03165 [Planctomycetes bacterium]|nr:hypothetical protein [Planctomycetota bacterium]